ncbi:uncharacterized protein G2W53_035330 [Senna tora]|uniref:Reverse transcriptase n=1 Tax=Senna tora TaxID=362788 RepID=A0A834SRJ7_9FABA|nr:uncharacterized protein G2W53_035330 [Senna tora]
MVGVFRQPGAVYLSSRRVKENKDHNPNNQSQKLGPWLRAGQSGRRILRDWGKCDEAEKSNGGTTLGAKKSNKVNSEVLMEKLRTLTVKETSVAEKVNAEKAVGAMQIRHEYTHLLETYEDETQGQTNIERNLFTIIDMHTSSSPVMPNEEEDEDIVKGVRMWKRLSRQGTQAQKTYQAVNPLKRGRETLSDISNFPSCLEADEAAMKKLRFKENVDPQRRDRKVFRFEQMWTTHEDCDEIIKDHWKDWRHDASHDRLVVALWCTMLLVELVMGKIRMLLGITGSQVSRQFRWKRDDIVNMFSTRIANNILGIPLSSSNKEDGWYWTLTPSGFYSVKTGYRTLRQVTQQSTMEADHFSQFTNVWQRIWKAKMPAKIKIFVWRACREVLPVRASLNRRGLDVVDDCPSGCSEEETVLHALIGCPELLTFWRRANIPLSDQYDASLPFVEWFDIACSLWDADTLVRFAICAYNVWHRRNEIWIGKNVPNTDRVLEISLSFLNELQKLLAPENPSRRSLDSEVRWERPCWPLYKVNVDASLNQGLFGGIGGIIRDSRGKVLAAMANRVPRADSVEILEAKAILVGLEFARDLRILDVVVEGDSQVVFNYINRSVDLRSPVGSVLASIRTLRSCFRRVEFRWVPRLANRVADKLACLGQSADPSKQPDPLQFSFIERFYRYGANPKRLFRSISEVTDFIAYEICPVESPRKMTKKTDNTRERELCQIQWKKNESKNSNEKSTSLEIVPMVD